MFKKSLVLRHALVLLSLLAFCSSAGALDIAKVGKVHEDGRVELYLERFQPTLQGEQGNHLTATRTSFRISNGFLYIVRFAADGCTTEEFPALVQNPEGGLSAINSPLREGIYVPVTDFPMATASAGKDIFITHAEYFTCENVSCPENHACQLTTSSPIQCQCVRIWPPADDLPTEQSDGYPYEDGCERRRDLIRPSWALNQSVDATYIQAY